MARTQDLVAVLLTLSFALEAQDTQASKPSDSVQQARERALSKTRTQLEARPTHAQVFDHYFKLVVESNALESEVKLWESKLAKEAGEQTSSIILGKLLLRTGKEERALEVLDGIATKTPEIQSVLGEIYQKLARHDQASRAYEAALPSAVTSEAKRVLYEKIGKCHLALGKKAQAMATWEKIGELDGGKFHRRLRVAELLVEAGLLPEAEKAYEPLLGETSDDPAQLCRVMRDQGRLQELQGKLEKALATYEEILQKTARGNWLRKEIEGRVVQIHRRTGKLDALLARLETQRKEQPDDLGTAELLSDVYVETRKPEQAIVVLAATTPRFPNDAKLARRLAQLYVERNQLDEAIAEYQRILTAKPDELELYLELGQLFAKGDKFKEAKNQWEKVLAKNLKDAGLCARIASMYALYEREEDAVRLYERAIEIEPESMQRYTDLSEYLFARNQGERAKAVLSRALQVAEGKPRRLEALAGTLREHDLVEEAKRCLEAILKVEPNNQEQRYALADLLLSQKQQEAAKALLWQVLEADDKGGGGQRTQAANTLVQLAFQVNGQAGLEAEASAKASAGAAFLLGRLHSRGRDFEKAIASFRVALERKADDIEARRLLARLLSDEGDFAAALAEYAKVEHLQPGEGKRLFREVARLHLETYELEKAIEVWQKAMRDNPDNASVFVEVGKEFLSIQRVPEALEAFQQAARLKANDPDIQLRLADALKQAGKPEDAEKLLLEVAQKALDARDREQARNKLFELVAEQGLIDKRIESLTGTVSENPYDKDAPQLLADLYMRTGDYVLGLEMVERAVNFQPKNKELLTRRAELLEALEEWDKAKAAHEELLKFPDAERDVHLAGIGQALYEAGKATEAKAVFEKIQDRGRVAALYKKYELREEAIEYYKRAIRKNPGDLRSYVDLAEQLVERNKQVEAIEVLERGLNLNASHRKSLELLGKLYVQNDRRQDAVKCGMRLFGLRGEEVEKTRREEYEEGKSGGYDWIASQPFGQQRLYAAQSYFEERGLKEEWGTILVAEAKRRPTNMDLLQAVQQHYSWRDKSASKLAAFLTQILEKDLSASRIPPGYTARSYRQYLEATLVQVWQSDAAVAEARIAAIGAPKSPVQWIERAKLRQVTGRLDEAEKDLRAALALDASAALAHALLVDILVEQKRYADAIPHVDAMIAWWKGPGAAFAPEIAARDLVRFRQERKQMLDELPRRLRRKVTDEQLMDVIARTQSAEYQPMFGFSFPEVVPQPFALHGKKVRLCRAANDGAGMSAASEAALAAAKTLSERQALGELLFQEEQKEKAGGLLRSVLEEGERLQRDPEQIHFWPRYQGVVAEAALAYGELLTQQGKPQDAYRVLRQYGHREKAEAILAEGEVGAAIAKQLEESTRAAADRLTKARVASAKDLETVELDYRDEVIKLADFRIGQKEFDGAEAIYQESLTLLPDDIEIRGVLAKMRKRRAAFPDAIKTHEEIIAVKRRLKRAHAGETSVPPTRLRPSAPDEDDEDRNYGGRYVSYSIGGRYYSRYSGGYSSGSGNDRYPVAENYLAILGIHSERNDPQGIFDAIRKIMQEDPATFRDMSWQVLDTLRNQDLGKKKLPVLRILKSVVQSDEWLTLEYARACIEENELAEARRVLEKFLAKQSASGGGWNEEVERELEKVAQKLGESKTTIADLRKVVAGEPDNVRHRMRLAERLKKEHDYAGLLTESQEIVKRAPYLMRAKEMVVEAAAACGKDAVAMEMMKKLFEESSGTYDKLRRGVNLANWLQADGKTEESFAMMRTLEVQSGGSQDFSPGTWFLDKHELKAAVESYTKEVEKAKTQQWDIQRLRPRLVRLEFALGKSEQAIGRCLEAIGEAGSLGDREQRFKDLLRVCKDHPDPKRLAAELASHAARKDVNDLLVMAAVAFAQGDVKTAAEDLDKAVQASSKEVYLFPLLLGLRRLDGDGEGALAVLERMSKVYGGSTASSWSEGVSLTERERLKLERAKILEEMGKADEVKATIESLLDETRPETISKIATIWKQKKKYDLALEWQRRYAQKLGKKERALLISEAELLLELGRIDEALPLVREAYKMARGENGTREMLIRIAKKEKKLPELTKELEADFAKDPRNQNIRNALLGLYDQQRREEDVRRIYETMRKQEDLREGGLRGLIGLASKRRDWPKVIELQTELTTLKGGEEKKQVWREIADSWSELEKWNEAEEAFKKALDLGTAEGWTNLAEWLAQHERHDRALVAWTKVLELDKEREAAFYPFAKAAWRAKDFANAFAKSVEWLRKDRAKTAWWGQEQHSVMLDALTGMPEADRTRVLAESGDARAVEVSALASLLLCDFAAARTKAERALAQDPTALLALEVRRLALRHTGPLDALLDATEKLRLGIERAFMATSEWSYNERARTLQDDLGRIAHEMGNDAEAERLWKLSPMRRTPYGDPFGYWRGDWSVRYACKPWLSVRRPERALAAYATEFLQHESAPWNDYMRAVEDAGRIADVEAFAWQKLLDPLELYGVASGYDGYYWDEYGMRQQSSGAASALVRIYQRSGRLEELEKRATAMLDTPATRRQAESLLDSIAQQSRNKQLIAARAEIEVSRDSNDRNARIRAASAWARAGNIEKAIEHMKRVLDWSSDLLEELAPDSRASSNRRYYRSGGYQGPDNPFSFTFSDDRYSSWWSSGWDQEISGYRRTAAALLFASGDRERAQRIETKLLEFTTPGSRENDLQQLARAYEPIAPLEAVRLYRLAMEESKGKTDESTRRARTEHLAAIARASRRAGDRQGELAARKQHCDELAAEIGRLPGPHAFEAKRRLALSLAFDVGDHEAARRYASEVLRSLPRDTELPGLLAYCDFRTGKLQEALVAYRTIDESLRVRGVTTPVRDEAGHGLALVAAGKPEEAKRLLLRARFALGESDLADEVLRTLGGLK